VNVKTPRNTLTEGVCKLKVCEKDFHLNDKGQCICPEEHIFSEGDNKCYSPRNFIKEQSLKSNSQKEETDFLHGEWILEEIEPYEVGMYSTDGATEQLNNIKIGDIVNIYGNTIAVRQSPVCSYNPDLSGIENHKQDKNDKYNLENGIWDIKGSCGSAGCSTPSPSSKIFDNSELVLVPNTSYCENEALSKIVLISNNKIVLDGFAHLFYLQRKSPMEDDSTFKILNKLSIAGIDNYKEFGEVLQNLISLSNGSETNLHKSISLVRIFSSADGEVQVNNPADFSKQTDRLFNFKIKDLLKDVSTESMWFSWKGAMLGSGDIWIVPVEEDGIEQYQVTFHLD